MAYARILFSFFLSATLGMPPWSLHNTHILWSVQIQYRMIWLLWMGLLLERRQIRVGKSETWKGLGERRSGSYGKLWQAVTMFRFNMWGLMYFCGLWFSGLIFRASMGLFGLLLPLVLTGMSRRRKFPRPACREPPVGGWCPQTRGTDHMFYVGPPSVLGSLLLLPSSISGFGWRSSGEGYHCPWFF